MKYIYWFKRTLRRLIRNLFHDQVPDWFAEIYEAFAYVNFVNLIPTLWAIMTVPEHFFRRVDLLVTKRKAGKRESLYKTPVQLITTIMTLTWTTKWLGAYVPVGKQKVFFAALLLLMPLLIPMICLVLIPLSRLSFWIATHGLGSLIYFG